VKAVSQFEKTTPSISINLESVPADAMLDKLLTAVKAGQGPDVVSSDSAWIAELAAAKAFSDVTTEFASIKSEFFPGTVDGVTYNGKQYAVPWYTNNVALFWNKKTFKAAGISGPPTTWDDLVTVGEQLTKNGNYGFMMGSDGNGSYLWLPFLWQAGGELFTSNGKAAAFNSAAGQAAWEYYASLPLMHHIVPPSYLGAGLTWEQYYTPFLQEQAAMMTQGDWAITPLQQGNPGLEFGIAPLPVGKERATVLGGYTLGIPTTSKNREAAWKFIQWLTAAGQEWILESYQRVPTRVDVEHSALAKNPLETAFLEQAPYGRAQPNIPAWDNIICNAMSNGWDATIHGASSVLGGLDIAVKQTNKYLQDPTNFSLSMAEIWDAGVWDAPGWTGSVSSKKHTTSTQAGW
jgi:ABC-type glycerol-3-phosphate transport system substrate-binding protein